MKKYLLVTKISILDTMQYRADFLLKTLKYATMVMLMSLVWIGVQQSADTELMNAEETVRYFFLAAIIYSLSNFHTWYIEEDIKLGELSKLLTKPISPFLNYLSFESGKVIVETIFKIIVIPLILYLIGYSFSLTFSGALILALYMPIIFIFTFNLFALISGLAFWLTDAFALRWSTTIIMRFLSGIFVPISFFPESFQYISSFLPFQYLAYTPIQMVNGQISFNTALNGLLILICWSVVVAVIRFIVWKSGSKNYESTGI